METLSARTPAAIEEIISEALEANNDDQLRALIAITHPADIAEVMERLNPEAKLKIFRMLDLDQVGDTLHEMGSDAIREVFSNLTDTEIAHYLNPMPMDDAARIVTEVVPERQEAILAAMGIVDAQEVRNLIQYPPQSAGRLMTEKFVRIRPDMTVETAIAHLRHIDPEVETITDLYVLDEQRHLLGVVSLRELITAPYESRIEDIMTKDVVYVTPEVDQEIVARSVSKYDFLAMPVADANRVMLGVITVDDIIHVLVEEGSEDQLRFGGVEGGATVNQPYFTVPIPTVIRHRIGWLLLLFVAETLTGSVLRIFEHELAAVVSLSFFIPLLIGTGGNTGSQTVSTIIRGLALGEIRFSDTGRVIVRELGSGLLLGLLLGLVAFARTILWGGLSLTFCLVIGLTILAICTWANAIGAAIPLIASRLKIDPAVVSAPLITTLVDATGLAIYLLIAKALLGI
jgi:magnesium transporter